MRKFLLLLAGMALASLCLAVQTKSWIQNEQSDFEKGTLKRLSLRSDGRLLLAPAFREVFDSATPYLWSLASDSKGTLYTGGGGSTSSTSKLFAVDATGKSRTIADVPGMQIQAIAVDKRDRVYAGTAPDGRVFRIENGKAELFYDPKAKYIWAMVFNSKGDLFVATGDGGEVHRVGADGHGGVFFRTEETHARSLAVDSKDNLIVGTEPGGLVIRVGPSGDGFVLYQAGKREVTSVGVTKDGIIYAAAAGNRSGTSGAPSAPSPLSLPVPPALPSSTQPSRSPIQPTTHQPVPLAGPPSGISGGSELYRIERDDYARKIWSHPSDVVYAIIFDAAGRPLLGTGNKGNIYRIESDIVSTLLINADPTQITAFAGGPAGRVYVASGNTGKVFQIGPDLEKDGSFESDVFDGSFFSYWGRLTPKGTGTPAFETRSGNLDRPHNNWSVWAPVKDGHVASPSARFLQYRTTLRGNDELSQVEIAYMPKNVAPIIEEIEITPANYKFSTPSSSLNATPNITLPAMGGKKRTGSSSVSLESSSSQTLNFAKGNAGARWLAKDANDDDLVFRVEIRGVKESEWKLLKEKVKEHYISWDSTAFPDGDYVVRVTASDSPDNPPGQALTNVIESDPFLIDNTPPRIAALAGTRSGNNLTVRWKAKDAFSIIEKAEYSVNGGEWLTIQPTTRLSDAQALSYELILDSPKGETTIAVRVTDEFENQAVDKVVIN